MHAWVRAWCGNETGWLAYDPTNATFAGEDHIAVAIGRDYGGRGADRRRAEDCGAAEDEPVGGCGAGVRGSYPLS